MTISFERAFPAAVAVAASFLLGGCAERRSPIETSAHPVEWSQSRSADFHGTRVLRDGVGGCEGCHGAGLAGDASVPGCDDCHAGAGGHPFGWAARTSPEFHGDAVRDLGPTPCKVCHGSDYSGGWSDVGCADCHAGGPSGHPDGWMQPEASSFHGLRMLVAGVESCTPCHGPGLGGGSSGLACGTCHEVVGEDAVAFGAGGR